MSETSGLLKLSDLVEEGRYYIQNNRYEQIQYGCHECIDKTDVEAAVFTEEVIDPVDLLKWIERHEAEHHAPTDLQVQVSLMQIMTAYAQQAGKNPEEMFPQQFEVPASPYGGVDPSAWDGTEQDDPQEETDPEPPAPKDDDHGTCAVCGRPIFYWDPQGETHVTRDWHHQETIRDHYHKPVFGGPA